MGLEEPFASQLDLRFELPLEIVKYPDPRLRAKNKRINNFDEGLKNLAREMFDVMYKTNAVGLAAPQIGMNVQLMVFNAAGKRVREEETVLVNPHIKGDSGKMVSSSEACLSLPGLHGLVERPDSVEVEAQDIDGKRFELSLTGLPARVFQHEYDHLQGILYTDRLSDKVLESVRMKLQALEKSYEERTGLPSPEKIDARSKHEESRSMKKVHSGLLFQLRTFFLGKLC